MTFEGEHKIIPVKGIARAGADTLCEDGAMNEVIGLEYKDGSYVPYSAEAKSYLPSGIKFFLVHKTSAGNNVIICFYGGGRWQLSFMPEKDFLEGKGTDYVNWYNFVSSSTGFNEVTQSKNIIIIETADKLLYYRFTGDAYEQINIDDIGNNLPYLNFTVDFMGTIKIDNAERGGQLLTYSTENSKSEQAVRNLYNKGVSKLNELGRLHGYVLALYAYKLVSGDYVYASAPVLLTPPNDNLGIDYANEWNTNTYYTNANLSNETGAGFLKYIDEKLWKEVFIESEYASIYPPVAPYIKQDNGSGLRGSVHAYHMPAVYASLVWHQVSGASYSSIGNLVLSQLSNRLLIDINGTIDSKYDGLIESCCIFLSDQVPMYDVTTDENISRNNEIRLYNLSDQLTDQTVLSYYFHERDIDNIINDIKGLRGFYKVHEIDFKDITTSSNVEIKLEGKLGDNLFLQDTLPISAFMDRKQVGGKTFCYNSRNHIYDYFDKLTYFNDLRTLQLRGGEGQYDDETTTYRNFTVVAEIDSMVEGKSIVVTDKSVIGNYLNGYISYPNASAKKLWLIHNGPDFVKEFDLVPSKSGGYAYAINAVEKPISKEKSWFAVPLDKLQGDWDYLIDNTPPSENNTLIMQDNKIKVSQPYFVYSFDNANNYVVGNGRIIGMASLSIALSQDTFGQYPLLVFCTDGIYSMGVDTTGAGVYSNISPFSREVCTNKNTICEIDGAVLFASSKGLMIASAQGVQEFLPALNGKPRHLPKVVKDINGLGLKLYRDVINHPFSTELLDSISNNDFIQFLSNADTVVSYVSNKNKVIVYNKNHNYSYWIDIPTRIVTKLPIGISMDNNNYPTEQYLLNNGLVLEFGYLSNNADVQCLLQSRPIKNTYGMKSTLRVIARGYFNSSDADNYAVMLVLGSYDAINWQPIGICQRPFAGGFNDLGCVTDRVSHKYVMVIITGKMSPDSHIDGIEMTINNKYNNKLK